MNILVEKIFNCAELSAGSSDAFRNFLFDLTHKDTSVYYFMSSVILEAILAEELPLLGASGGAADKLQGWFWLVLML